MYSVFDMSRAFVIYTKGADMSASQRDANRTKWGRVQFGGGRFPAMVVAIPGGVALAALTGVIAATLGFGGDRPWLGGTVLACCLIMPFVALIWVLVVDRMTLQGATDRPEESIENTWFTEASSGSYFDIIAVVGIAAAITTFADVDVQINLVLAAVIGFGMMSFCARYLLISRRG